MSLRKERRKARTGSESFNSQNSRIHRRALRRQAIACSINGQLHPPGTKVNDSSNNPAFTAGGALKYH